MDCKKYCHNKCTGVDMTKLSATNSSVCGNCSSAASTSENVSLLTIEQVMERHLKKLKIDLKEELTGVINAKFQQTNDKISVVEDNVKKIQSEVHQIHRSPLKHDVSRNINEAVLEMTERNELLKASRIS